MMTVLPGSFVPAPLTVILLQVKPQIQVVLFKVVFIRRQYPQQQWHLSYFWEPGLMLTGINWKLIVFDSYTWRHIVGALLLFCTFAVCLFLLIMRHSPSQVKFSCHIASVISQYIDHLELLYLFGFMYSSCFVISFQGSIAQTTGNFRALSV